MIHGDEHFRSTDLRSRSAAAQSFYGRWARLYDLLARYTPGIRRLRQQAAAACELSPDDTVVEMGCGTGANLPYLRSAVGPEGTVVGVDYTAGMLRRARPLVAGYDNVHLVRGDAATPPVPDADAVLASFVVGMLDDPAATVDAWCDLASPDGNVVLLDAAPASGGTVTPFVNALFRALVVVSTPPTLRLRYDRDLAADLDGRVAAAHDAVRDRSAAVADETHVLGVVRLTGGRIE